LICPEFKIFYHSPFLPKERGVTEHFRQKRRAKCSVVFVTVRFWIFFVVAFLVKKWSQTSRFWQKREVKLIIVGKNAE
jgi:hypothetical protein